MGYCGSTTNRPRAADTTGGMAQEAIAPMQAHRTDGALVYAVDPGSGRLAPADVVTIHRQHLDQLTQELHARKR